MVLKEDGSKWACQACLKGHRVSGCDHTNRELTLVPKKGRPVTQCAHCRKERKKRSSHNSCSCGLAHTRKDKCRHLREAEAMSCDSGSELPKTPSEGDESHSDHNSCCCHHGESCVCAGSSRNPGKLGQKPRLTTIRSDPHMSINAIGVHKTTHHHPHGLTAQQKSLKHHLPRADTDELPIRESADGRVVYEPDLSQFSTNDMTHQVGGSQQFLGLVPATPFNFSASYQQSMARSVDSFLPLTAEPHGIDIDSTLSMAVNGQGIKEQPATDPATQTLMEDGDWTKYDWSYMSGDVPAPSGLDSASSNAVSHFDQMTPQDFPHMLDASQIYSLYAPFDGVSSTIFRSDDKTTAPPQPLKTIYDDAAGSNRWSLPASFTDIAPCGLHASPVMASQLNPSTTTNAVGLDNDTFDSVPWEKLLEQHPAGDLWSSNSDMPVSGDGIEDFAFGFHGSNDNSTGNGHEQIDWLR